MNDCYTIEQIEQVVDDVNRIKEDREFVKNIKNLFLTYDIDRRKIMINYLTMKKGLFSIDKNDYQLMLDNLKEINNTRKLNEKVVLSSKYIYKPVYILLTYTGTVMSKIIKNFTNDPYSHSSISFDPELRNIYSFGRKNKGDKSKFVIEDIQQGIYKKNNNVKYSLYCVFLDLDTYDKLRNQIKAICDNKAMSYNFLGLLGFVFNKPIKREEKYFCSEFVATVLKGCGVPIKKDPSLVKPYDFAKMNEAFYISRGYIKNYNPTKTKNRVSQIKRLNTLQEYYSNQDCLSEVTMNFKKNPIDLDTDKDGELIIKKQETLNFMDAYMASHKLLMLYEKNNNIDGIKHELAKIWYLILIIESKVLYSSEMKKKFISKSKIEESRKARAFLLNDFNRYMNLVLKNDKSFNFDIYFNNTKYGEASYKISTKTVRAIKNLINTITI